MRLGCLEKEREKKAGLGVSRAEVPMRGVLLWGWWGSGRVLGSEWPGPHWQRAAQEDCGLRVSLADPEVTVLGGYHLTALTEGTSKQSTCRAALRAGAGWEAGEVPGSG